MDAFFRNGTDGYKVNIQGDGIGTMHLYNDIKKADVTVSSTTLDIGTSLYSDESLMKHSGAFLLFEDVFLLCYKIFRLYFG